MAELTVAALPWHPLAWWARWRLTRLSEEACDDWVLASGHAEVQYAESLLSLRPQNRLSSAMAGVRSRKSLRTRIRRILAGRCSSPKLGRIWTTLATGLTVVLAAAIALAQPRSEPVDEALASSDAALADVELSSAQEKQPTLVFAGQVLDPDGKPVAGVRVRSDVSVWRPRSEDKLDEAHTRTDEHGRFELGELAELDRKRASRTIVFEHPDFAIAWFKRNPYIDIDPRQIRLHLVRPLPVGGLVTDEQDRPVAGATVAASIQFFSREEENTPGAYGYFSLGAFNQMAATTDAQGRFVLEKIPEGARLHLTVRHPRHANFRTEDGYHSGTHPIKAGDRNMRIRLSPGGTIQGCLVREGKPLTCEGVLIKAGLPSTTDVSSHTRTDAEGRFTLTGLSDGHYVVFAERGYLPDPDIVCAPARDVHVKAAQDAVEIDLECTEGRVLTGRVLNEETSQPLAERNVMAQIGKNFRIEVNRATTDEEGRYRLRLPPGEYQLKARAWRRGNFQYVTKDVRVEKQGALPEVDFSVAVRPEFRGRLVDEQGQPVEGTVILETPPEKTAKDGTFAVPVTFGYPARTELGLAFSRDKSLAVAFYMSTLDPAADAVIVLKPVAEVRGRAVDSSGEPVPDAKAAIGLEDERGFGTRYYGRPPWRSEMHPDGTFVLSSVPTGVSMQFVISKPGYQTYFDLGYLRPGQMRDVGAVVLESVGGPAQTVPTFDATLSGRVLDEEKKPLAGATVRATGFGASAEDVTDLNGKFHLAKLPAGQVVSVSVQHWRYARQWFDWEFATGRDDVQVQVFPKSRE